MKKGLVLTLLAVGCLCLPQRADATLVTSGNTNFSSGGPQADVAFAVIANDGGGLLAAINAAFGGDDIAIGDDDALFGGGFDDGAEAVFLYQIDPRAGSADIGNLFIPNNGFLASSMGFFGSHVFTPGGAAAPTGIDDSATTTDPDFADPDDSGEFEFAWPNADPLEGGDVGPILYATFDGALPLSFELSTLTNGTDSDAFLPAPAPEPGTLLLLGTAMVGGAGFRRRRKKKAEAEKEETETIA